MFNGIGIFIIVGAIFAALCGSLARKKGYADTVPYTVLGFVLNVFGLLYVLGLPDIGAERQRNKIINELEKIDSELKNQVNNKSENVSSAKIEEELPPL